MKRAIAVALALGLLGGMMVGPADAGKKKKKPVKVERVVEIEYSSPGIGVAPVGGYPVNFPDGLEIPTLAEELFVKIEVEDASGQKIWGFISQGDIDGNGLNDDGFANFCGSHEEPVDLAAPGSTIIGVYMYNGACDDGTPSVMTSGTITMTFSNML